MNEINQYVQEGEIYLWEYKENKNYPGYQMAWSNAGRRSLQELLGLIQKADTGTYRTLRVSVPTKEILAVPNNGNSKIIAIEKLRIEISNNIDWQFSIEGATCSIKMLPEQAKEWSRIIEAVKLQEELSFRGMYFWW